MPVGKEVWLVLTDSIEPGPCRCWLTPQSLELLHCPSNEMLVDAHSKGVQLGAVEEGGGEDLPLPAPVKPDVSLSTHPAYHSDRAAETHPRHRVGQASLAKPTAFTPGPLQPLHRYYAAVRPSASHPVLSPSAFSLGVLPFPPISGEATTRLVPEFRTRAHPTFLPPLRRTPPGQERDNPARLIPGKSLGPGSDVIVLLVDASSEGSLSLNSVVLT